MEFKQKFTQAEADDLQSVSLRCTRTGLSHEMRSALQAIRSVMEIVLGDTPFSNNGTEFKNEVMHVQAYRWSDDDQPYNFKWRDFEVSWYKYLGRGGSMNRKPSEKELREMLRECIFSLLGED